MSATAAEAPVTLGRFELRRALARGANSQCWLAHDPQADRPVVIKQLAATADEDTLALMRRAEGALGLRHAHVLALLQVDVIDGQVCLVYEAVEGQTLAQARQGKRALLPRDAVNLLLGPLDALATAHEAGLLHGDLRPHNLLQGRDGVLRLMDFGIGPALDLPWGDGLRRVTGAAGYLAPEVAQGEAAGAAADVFGAGLLLAELLCGGPLRGDADPDRMVERLQREELLLPAELRLPPPLRAAVHQALARAPAQRWEDARALWSALMGWAQPNSLPVALPAGSSPQLAPLLRRLQNQSDFPAMSASIIGIQRIAASESESLQRLSREVMKDPGLTQKLLRTVNSAHFSAVAEGGISTVSRAIALVGFGGIRNMALSLVLLEHFSNKAHAAGLKEEFLRSLSAGTLADTWAHQEREGEAAFLGAMFQNLGRLLAECYLPEESLRIRAAMRAPAFSEAAALEREESARQVLGIGLDELGAAVARAWGLPLLLQAAVRLPSGTVPAAEVPRGVERLRWLGHGANAMTDCMLSHDGEAQEEAVRQVAARYAPALGLDASGMARGALAARGLLSQLARGMGIQVSPQAAVRRLLRDLPLDDPALADTAAQDPAATPTRRELLERALAELRQAPAASPRRVAEVLRRVLQAFQAALGFRAVVLCVRDGSAPLLQGRIGLGAAGPALAAHFRVPLDAAPADDLFAGLCARGADLLVSDARTVAKRLPAWYRAQVQAGSFLVLPVMSQGAVKAMVYADQAEPGAIVLDEAELQLMRALRDEAARAFTGVS